MNRRFVVLGLAVAMCSSVVAGQTAQKDAPPLGLPLLDRLTPLVRLTLLDGMPALTAQAQLGPVVIRVESAGPKLTRLRVTRNGVELATLDSNDFTISTDAGGTRIASAGEMTVTPSSGTPTSNEMMWFTTNSRTAESVGGVEVRFPADRASWMVRRRDATGQTWRMYGMSLPISK